MQVSCEISEKGEAFSLVARNWQQNNVEKLCLVQGLKKLHHQKTFAYFLHEINFESFLR